MRLSQGSALRWMEPFFNNPTAIATSVRLCRHRYATRHFGWRVRFIRCVRVARSDEVDAVWPLLAGLCRRPDCRRTLGGVNFRALLMTTFVLACGLAGLAGAIVTFYMEVLASPVELFSASRR